MQDINGLYNEVREIITSARQNAVRSVDFTRVQMYWKIGRRIQEEEQKGKERADYGTYLLKNLAKKLEPEYGSGFSVRQLEMCRQFYRVYPIANTVCAQLTPSPIANALRSQLISRTAFVFFMPPPPSL